jgi:hypothetical protein
VQYPPLGAVVSKERGKDEAALPSFVSIAPHVRVNPAAYGSGFLGPRHAPLVIGTSEAPGMAVSEDQALKVHNLDLPRGISQDDAAARIALLQEMQKDFLATRPDVVPRSHQASLDRAIRLMHPSAVSAFDLAQEKSSLRDAYGRNRFGQGCLLARRLIERDVPFVEVTLGGLDDGVSGWDTHAQNFDEVRKLSAALDPAWATLMDDLQARGLLDSTLIVWMGEFGRTPKINQLAGRDHYPRAWSTVLAGGGIRGGQVVGKTSPDGMDVSERPVTVRDFLATIYLALGIDPTRSNLSNVGRPIDLVDKGAKPLKEVLA